MSTDRITLQSTAGPLSVLVQADGRAMVEADDLDAGRGARVRVRYSHYRVGIEAVRDIETHAAGTVSENGHPSRSIRVQWADGSWSWARPESIEPREGAPAWVLLPGYSSYDRLWQVREVTDRQAQTVTRAICDALTAWSATPEGIEAMAQATAAERVGDIAKREATARELRALAEHLDREAQAIREGGREVWVEYELTSGHRDKALQVQTVAGELMPAPKDPPTISGSSRYPTTGAHVRSSRVIS